MKTKNHRAGRGRQRRALLACTALVALPAAALAQDGTVTLQPITVETASDETSIVAGEVTGASGMPTDILDTPASVSVVTAAEIEQRGAESVEEVLQYTPGVLTDNWGADERFDAFRIRGFNAFTYRDGLRLGSSDRGGPREEVFAFERVEVVKGGNSTTFGISDPGGSVNYVSKTPRIGRFGEIYGSVGSFERKEIGFDFGDDLAPDGTLSYRLTGKFRDADDEFDHSRDDERFLMGGLTWRPTAATELTFLLDHLDRDGVPGSGGHPVGEDLDRDLFLGEPSFNYRGTERTAATLLVDHDFGNGLTFGSAVRYSDTESDFGYAYVSGTVGGTTASRDFFVNDSTETDLIGDAHLLYDTTVGTVRSRTLVGVEASHSESDGANWFTAAPDIDWEDPVYTGGLDLDTLSPYVDRSSEDTVRAVYLQQELTFDDRFIAQLGLRHDWLDLSQTNNLTGVTEEADLSETTARVGFTYKITPELSAYASYAESVVPASLTVDPERGEQYEVGLKYRPAGARALITAAMYDLTKSNITRTNPATLLEETIGGVNVRGIDLEAKVEMFRNLDLTAGYSYLDSEIVEDGTRGNEGNEVSFVPEHMASLWLNYTLEGAGSRGDMTFGLGARYTGGYWFDDANTQSTGDSTIFDAAYSYQLRDDTELSVHVSNLFDEKHVAYGGFGADFYNQGRRVSATLRHTW